MGCCTGRFTSALRKRPYGEPLSGYSLQIGSHSGSEGAFAATTPDRQPRLINGDPTPHLRESKRNNSVKNARGLRYKKYELFAKKSIKQRRHGGSASFHPNL